MHADGVSVLRRFVISQTNLAGGAAPWAPLTPVGSCLVPFLGAAGASWAYLVPCLGVAAAPWAPLTLAWAYLVPFLGAAGASWAHLARAPGDAGASWVYLVRFLCVAGASWAHPCSLPVCRVR